MIAIDNTLISDDIRDVCFICDLAKCKGACCVEGDAGAPLEEEEIAIIEDALDEIKPLMTPDGIAVVEKSGVFDYDMFGHFVTPLVHDHECAFVYFEKGIALCAIEKAFEKGLIDFRKPISCHLYPIRISGLHDFTAVNYHEWEICNAALRKGKAANTPLYIFLKEPLIRKYGEKWYNDLVKHIELPENR
ncbi:MAG TPA: DUF3109 family protein [Bacteroidales bacterium]|nr:DUF3109 family protein [Bacteroidales bacterium]